MRGWLVGLILGSALGCAEMDEFVHHIDAYQQGGEVYQSPPPPPLYPNPSAALPRITNQSNEPELLK